MTDVVEQPGDLHSRVVDWKCAGQQVGFVPTMGAYHSGHRRLMQASVEENDETVVSLFVNPTQFRTDQQAEAYPQDFPSDHQVLKDEQVDLVFHPDPEVLYPEGDSTMVQVEHPITRRFEGENKPRFFAGVARVLSKLFHIVPSDRVYFGEKDLQQLCMVRRLIRDLHFPHELRMVPTVRDEHGIAYSSRNKRFSDEDWETARRVMGVVDDFCEREDECSRDELDDIRQKLRAAGMDLEYFDVVGYPDFQSIEPFDRRALVIFAGFVGSVRMKDNFPLHFDSVRQLEDEIELTPLSSR